MTLADLLFAPVHEIEANDVVVHVGADVVTHGELTEQAERVRDALLEAGVEAGMPVAAMLGNNAGTIAALFGVWAAGAVYVPLNPRASDDEIARFLTLVAPAAVLTTSEHAPRFGRVPVTPYLVIGQHHVLSSDQIGKRHDADVALVQMTSGTTGPPKPVLLTHSGVLALLDGVLRKVRGVGPVKRSSTPNLVPVSLSLWAGIYNVCFALRVGAPIVLMERFEPSEFAALVQRHAVHSVVLPPAALAMLCDDDTVGALEPLEWVRSITAPLSPFLARRFHERFGIGVLNSYGQTELGGEIVGWNAADWRKWGTTKLGAVGRPHDGVEIRATDDGELVVRTSALIKGYADGDGLNDRMTDDGWFRTGDMGSVDDDGFVWIEGRVSDQINRGGMKVTPAEVEEVLAAAAGVREVAVVGVPDERLGEVPVAFVVPIDPSAPPDPGTLEAHCRAHLGPWKVPVRFETLATLPRNEVGKVLKRELAKSSGDG